MAETVPVSLPSLEEMLSVLPKEIFELSSRKAFKKLAISIVTISLGVALLAISPWYLLPVGWIFMGTAITGLFTVGYSCGQNMFFKNKVTNYLVGTLCMLPLMYPLEYWKSKKEALTHSRFANSPLWFLSSISQWVASNFTFDFSKRMVVSAFVLYVFAAIFFPLVTYGVGLWGLFKYYIIPLLVYHFWMSTFLKANVTSLLSDSPVFFRFPSWVQFLSNDFSYGMALVQNCSSKLVPTCKWQDAYKALKKEYRQSLQELSFVYLILTGKVDEKAVQRKNAEKSPDLSEKVGSLFSQIYWPTTSFLLITPMVALYGIITLPFNWKTYALAFVSYYIAGIGITAGYHRLFSHRSFDASFPLKVLLLFMGTTAFEMSVFDWAADHRAHHRYTDTDKDPYNVKRGFWWAHMGWLMCKREDDTIPADISDLQRDPLLRFQHKYFLPLALAFGFGLPTVIAGYYWGDWMGGFFISGVFSKVVMLHCTFCINSLAHYVGEATYTDQRSPRDSVITSLVTFGEGYHNFHHEFPYDYRNGIEWLSYDPGKWLIYVASLFGLATNLKRFPAELFAKGRIQMEQKKLDKKKQQFFWGKPVSELPVVTLDYVQKQKEKGESLIVVSNVVYDVTTFAGTHPGGTKIVDAYVGKDATNAFNGGVYNHSFAARNILDTLRVARIQG